MRPLLTCSSHLFLFALLMTGCSGGSGPEGDRDAVNGARNRPVPERVKGISYANGFELTDHANYRVLKVFDPWQNSRGIIYTYILGEDKACLPDSLQRFPFIPVPVERVVVMSTTHLAFISQLDQAAAVKGMSGTNLVYDPEIRNRIANGLVREVGYEQGIDYEQIVEISPDVVFTYGVEGTEVAVAEKLRELGVQVVFCGEYLETHPLGKAEWIKFFASFFGQKEEAGSWFRGIDSAYHTLTALAGRAVDRPEVLTGLPWKDTWYMAGGSSYAARLIRDAGGNYLWSDHPSQEAVPLDLESVYTRALRADIWINPGAVRTLEQLAAFDSRFRDLPACRSEKVFNNDLRLGAGGGNDYWESGVVRPDLVLKDLIKVFHPDLLEDHPLVYYRKLK